MKSNKRLSPPRVPRRFLVTLGQARDGFEMSNVTVAVPRSPFLPFLLAKWERGKEHRPLPPAPNYDGTPVWVPPTFDYSHLIDEEYDKKREGVLKYTGGDGSRATIIMDLTQKEHCSLFTASG